MCLVSICCLGGFSFSLCSLYVRACGCAFNSRSNYMCVMRPKQCALSSQNSEQVKSWYTDRKMMNTKKNYIKTRKKNNRETRFCRKNKHCIWLVHWATIIQTNLVYFFFFCYEWTIHFISPFNSRIIQLLYIVLHCMRAIYLANKSRNSKKKPHACLITITII